MSNRPLQVLLVSSDRVMLRHANRLLTVFGYQVNAAVSAGRAAALLQTCPPDILLLDGSAEDAETLDVCRQAGGVAHGYIYKMVLVKEIKAADAVRWLEAGVDDILGLPLEHGELLARMRTAVRVLEFERRLARVGGEGKVRLPSRQIFISGLEAELAKARSSQQTIACIVAEIDHARTAADAHFRRFNDEALRRLAEPLAGRRSEVLAAGNLDEFRFAAVVRGAADAATAFAGRLRSQLAASEKHGDKQSEKQPADERLQPTVSCGIADSSQGAANAEELVQQAEAGLVQAQASGGDFVAAFAQFADEEKQWVDFAQNGALFERTLARDIMVPCTVVVRKDDTLSDAAALFDQTQLQALPVVDEEGKLAGLLTASTVRLRLAGEGAADSPVSSATTSDVASFDERTTLDALIDYFTQESPLAIAIVHKGRPTGLVTPSSLATLSEQLTTDSFAAADAGRGHAALIVPNFCALDA